MICCVLTIYGQTYIMSKLLDGIICIDFSSPLGFDYLGSYNDLCPPSTENKYAVLKIKDVTTGAIYTEPTVQHLQTIIDNIELFTQYNDGTMEFSYDILGDYESLKEKHKYLEKYYVPNKFNSKFDKNGPFPINTGERWSFMGIVIRNYEEDWVDEYLDRSAIELYESQVRNGDKHYKVFGSFSHRGFVMHLINTLRSMVSLEDSSMIKNWIKQIGNSYDPEKIKSLKSTYSESIYKAGFYSDDVKLLSVYCELMFGINIYEVAKLFVTKDVSEVFDNVQTPEDLETCFITMGDIYAENNNLNQALECYKQAQILTTNQTRQMLYQHKIENLINYHNLVGTCVLFSSI